MECLGGSARWFGMGGIETNDVARPYHWDGDCDCRMFCFFQTVYASYCFCKRRHYDASLSSIKQLDELCVLYLSRAGI